MNAVLNPSPATRTTKDWQAADAAHYLHVISPVDSHNALQLLLDQYADYSSFLRPEAALLSRIRP